MGQDVSFKDILIVSSGGHFVQQSITICAILGNICDNLRGPVVLEMTFKDLSLFLALLAIMYMCHCERGHYEEHFSRDM